MTLIIDIYKSYKIENVLKCIKTHIKSKHIWHFI